MHSVNRLPSPPTLNERAQPVGNDDSMFFITTTRTLIFDVNVTDQNRKAWLSYKRAPKEVLEKVYEDENRRRPVLLPVELTKSPIASSTIPRRQQDANPAVLSQPGTATGWFQPPVVSPPGMPYYHPYPPVGPPGAPYYPSHSMASPPIAPYYLPHHPAGPSRSPHYPPYPVASSSSNPLTGESERRSPSNEDEDEDVTYPTISEFLKHLGTVETDTDFHYFTSYTESFHQKGYYRIDQLADENFTIKDMMESIANLREGTAREIKKRAAKKVKQIQKGKGKK